MNTTLLNGQPFINGGVVPKFIHWGRGHGKRKIWMYCTEEGGDGKRLRLSYSVNRKENDK
ncbi:hypothetical protein A2U01_0074479, partial [Trifolium medium]|nr:hypothetical protein [Trifolium medium]